MSLCNGDSIDVLTQEAIAHHVQGDYIGAETLRLQAAQLAGPTDARWPGIMTTIAAVQERFGKLDEAIETANTAHVALYGMLTSTDTEVRQRAIREYPIALGYVGTLAVKKGLLENNQSLVKAGHADQETSWARFEHLHTQAGKLFHQHKINFGRRVSIGRSMTGHPIRGLGLAISNTLSGFFSESPRATAQTSGLNQAERVQAKKKAVFGGLGAIAVAGLQIIPSKPARSKAKQVALAAL